MVTGNYLITLWEIVPQRWTILFHLLSLSTSITDIYEVEKEDSWLPGIHADRMERQWNCRHSRRSGVREWLRFDIPHLQKRDVEPSLAIAKRRFVPVGFQKDYKQRQATEGARRLLELRSPVCTANRATRCPHEEARREWIPEFRVAPTPGTRRANLTDAQRASSNDG